MKRMKTKWIQTYGLSVLLIAGLSSCSPPHEDGISKTGKVWPELSSNNKPWTRWWWMGNAVDKENLTRRLEEFSDVGIGGVEITPIYGVKGYENQFLQHLSPEWMEMFIHTLDEAERLGLGVDMVMGTGWPFGGPQVEPEYAASKISVRTFSIKSGERLEQKLHANLQYLLAFDPNGKKLEVSSLVVNGMLEWTPEKDYTLYAIFLEKSGQMVKRASPGGEGLVLDHFSEVALEDYLKPYELTLGAAKNKLRALFNDSYEVYGAGYTPRLFDEFKKRRGYDLADHIPDLIQESAGESSSRVLCDYRETLSDLLLEAFSEKWNRWAHAHSFKTKYQAHGSPGNLLDIYATADIPECESFYGTKFDIPGVRWEESDANLAQPDLIMLKFASSAAHISGKELCSSESLTWLREHFKSALSQCKPEIEQLFLSGVNHTFFHGSTYFPDEADWPGWKFYASVNFVPTSTLWKDASYMFEYISRCQSMLQSGESDNELLVYWPYHDVISEYQEGKLLMQLGIDNKEEWLVHTPFYKLVTRLIEQGYSLDFISDRYLKKAEVKKGKISLSGLEFKALLVPDCKHMKAETFASLTELSLSGGVVLFEDLPESVPGFHAHQERTDKLLKSIRESEPKLILTPDISSELSKRGIQAEALVDLGLDFIRRDLDDGKMYYLVNHSSLEIDEYIPLNQRWKAVVVLDPRTGKTGLGKLESRKGSSKVYLQLKPGESLILRTFDTSIRMHEWPYYKQRGEPVEIKGKWTLNFLEGGPEIPEPASINKLLSWTNLNRKAEAFSGTARYSIEFDNPDPHVNHWLLDLGDVRESARVWINGEYLDCLWSVPFSLYTDKLQAGKNLLDIEVTNLSANRIRDLERKGIDWKIFYEINMVNRHYLSFDATGWEPMASGLLGTVTLTPLSLEPQ